MDFLTIILILTVINTIGLVVLTTKLLSAKENDPSEEFTKNRREITDSIKSFNDSILAQIMTFSQQTEQRLDKMRETIEAKLKSIQDDNTKKLEQMRVTVDEKLQSTLEKRLGESFKLVSERLEMVHKGLGEMHSLAAGVGDLKKVLTNVKARGIAGEIQLAHLLEEILTIEQYEKNVITKKGSNDRVEFAVKLPGNKEGKAVLLPIDAKSPNEDYQKLLDAYESGDIQLTEKIGKDLETRIKNEARDIQEKYIDPPNTTDFGILFLPYEGLYAEVLRRPGFWEQIQKDYKVTIAGPTTVSALLNSLQMGFKTLAIEKRSSEVWELLSAVKTEFGRFGIVLEKTHKKLQEASNTIEDAARKSRTIERKLKDVQGLPKAKAAKFLLESSDAEESENNSDEEE